MRQPKNRMHTRSGRVVAGEMTLWMCALSVVVGSAIFAKERGSLPALAQISTNAPQTEPTQPSLGVVERPIDEEAIAQAIESAGTTGGSDGLSDEPIVVELPETDTSIRWFDGRKVRPVRTIYMTVTGYSPDARSCGKFADNKTSTMFSVWTNGMNLVAADPRVLPYRSMISVPGSRRPFMR